MARTRAGSPAEESGTKESPVTKTPATKAPAKNAAAKTTVAKNTVAKNTMAKNTVAKRPLAKKPVAQKPVAQKSVAKKSAVPKIPLQKDPTAGTTDRPPEQPATEKDVTNVEKAPAYDLAVKPDEDPWTAEELAEVRGELLADRERLRSQLNLAEHELHDLMRDAGDGAGHDQADVGSTTFERDQEMSLAKNAREMLDQTERALLRIDDGSYGRCERCGQPIGKMRVMAFPRATLCLSCKQREERR